jgi:quinol-cytochrome oxidoreductase complex cytochrome b subunit
MIEERKRKIYNITSNLPSKRVVIKVLIWIFLTLYILTGYWVYNTDKNTDTAWGIAKGIFIFLYIFTFGILILLILYRIGDTLCKKLKLLWDRLPD